MQQLLSLNARIISDVNVQLFGQNEQAHFTTASDSVDINAYRAYHQGIIGGWMEKPVNGSFAQNNHF